MNRTIAEVSSIILGMVLLVSLSGCSLVAGRQSVHLQWSSEKKQPEQTPAPIQDNGNEEELEELPEK